MFSAPVATAFIEKRCSHVFSYGLNAYYYLWDPWPYAVKPQNNQKQLQAAFCAELQIMLINTLNRGAEEEEQIQSR
jgi:hypothetical protein